MNTPLISICIPAYKRIKYLKRLLASIEIQSFRDFEIIITDDSDDNVVLELIKSFESSLEIKYFKNPTQLGTPANWNQAISKANGEWIKLMHDDDWFVHENSLETFAKAISNGASFIYSSYRNFYEETNIYQPAKIKYWIKRNFLKQPMKLLSDNVIGPPSVTLMSSKIKEKYDERMKWRVDIDFYISVIQNQEKVFFIENELINIGISESQVTQSCLNIANIEIPEGYLLIKKFGTSCFKNIFVYDAWWRLIRNLNIRNIGELELYGQSDWPLTIINITKFQSLISIKYLRNGFISKFLMTFSYIYNYIFQKK